MDNTKESSDSDSNASTSWVLIGDSEPTDPTENIAEGNKYYLNCFSEPVQELTEKCLNSAGGDLDTDSDSIDVISKTDEDENVADEVETVGDCDVAVAENACKSYLGSYAFVVVVLAVSLLVTLFLSDDGTVVEDECEDSHYVDVSYSPRDVDAANDSRFKEISDINRRIDEYNYEIDKRSFENSDDCSRKTSLSGNSRDGSRDDFAARSVNKRAIKDEAKRKNKNKKRRGNRPKVLNTDTSRKNRRKGPREHCEADDLNNRRIKLKLKEKYLEKKEKLLMRKENELKRLERKLLKKLKNWPATKIRKVEKFNESVPAEWYKRLFDERSKLRKRDVDNWVFKRAKVRDNKRNKARWYFNWMADREALRIRRSFKHFAY